MAYRPVTRNENGEPLRRSRTGGARATKKKPKRRRLRRFLQVSLLSLLLLVLVGVGIFAVMYATTDIPSTNKVATSQTSIIQYDDGKEMGRLASENRENVTLDKVPKHVQNAVLAAENRDFRSEPGFSVSGYMRAAWALLRGQSLQGGSTITQQLVKKTYLTDARTPTRKFKELILSIKIERKLSKDQILEKYLNTVYYGRGAYGIQTASKAYFDKNVGQLSTGEAALLAGVIRNPSLYDPKLNPQNLGHRYNYVVSGMEGKGWLEPGQAPAKPPKVVDANKRKNQYRGQNGYLIQMVKEELERRGISEDELLTNGYRVRTTFDEQKIKYAVRAVKSKFPSYLKGEGVDVGMASIKPGTGEVKSIYGGPGYLKEQLNHATTGGMTQPGSSFKPYVLASALDQGISLNTTFNARSPQTVNGHSFGNSGGGSYGYVDMPTATQKSINTAYVNIGQSAGLENVVRNAKQLGYETSPWCKPGKHGTHMKPVTSLPLGPMDVCPLVQAGGIASFANEGAFVEPTTIDKVTKPSGSAIDIGKPKEKKVFSKGVAADTLYGMSRVAQPGGTAPGAALPNRPIAGKTGTSTQNRSAWFAGTIPQLTTTVAVYKAEGGTIPGVQGEVQGGTVPASIWHDYMVRATKNMKVEQLPDPAHVGQIKYGQRTGIPTKTTTQPSHTETSKSPTKQSPSSSPTPTDDSSSTSPPPTDDDTGDPNPTDTCDPNNPLPPCNDRPNNSGGQHAQGGDGEKAARRPD